MKLLTEEQRTKLLANGTRRGPDPKPVVKWFNAGGAGTLRWLRKIGQVAKVYSTA